VHEDLREFSRCDDELWDEIDSVVPITAELAGSSLVWTELSIKLSRKTESEFLTYISYRPQTWVRFRLALSPP
jgi:hypothetical protein